MGEQGEARSGAGGGPGRAGRGRRSTVVSIASPPSGVIKISAWMATGELDIPAVHCDNGSHSFEAGRFTVKVDGRPPAPLRIKRSTL